MRDIAGRKPAFRAAAFALCVTLIAVIVLGILLPRVDWFGVRTSREALLQAGTNFDAQRTLLDDADRRFADTSSRAVELPVPIFAKAGIHSATPIRGTDGTVLAVTYDCDGADDHFGLVVTAAAEAPPAGSTWPLRRQLANRLWYYDELTVSLER